jgi:uncharacterized protein YkwD
MRRRTRHIALALLVFAALAAPTGGPADGGAAAVASTVAAAPARAAGVKADAGAAARARAAGEHCPFADALPGQAAVDDARDATLCLMNAQRTARGLGRLRDQPALAASAARYARLMVRQRFFDHTSPGGSTMLSRIKATSYLRDVISWTVGENLAWGTGPLATPRATVQAWMRSADHRANLLARNFADVGVGIAQGAPEALLDGEVGGTYVTDFGRRRRG